MSTAQQRDDDAPVEVPPLPDDLEPSALTVGHEQDFSSLVGRHEGIPAAQYHTGPGASKHGLDQLDRSPRHYKWMIDHPEEEDRSAAKDVGQAFHVKMLEPHLFNKKVVVKPEGAPTKQSNAGKAFWASWETRHKAKAWITARDLKNMDGMYNAVQEHPVARSLLDPGLTSTEVTYYAIDPDTGCLVRCRVDAEIMSAEQAIVATDVKKTRDASYTAFVRDMAKYRYDVQAQFYTHVMGHAGQYEVLKFFFVAVEDEAPWGVNVFELGPEEKRTADIKWRRNLDVYAQCMKEGDWPGYSQDVRQVSYSQWQLNSPIR